MLHFDKVQRIDVLFCVPQRVWLLQGCNGLPIDTETPTHGFMARPSFFPSASVGVSAAVRPPSSRLIPPLLFSLFTLSVQSSQHTLINLLTLCVICISKKLSRLGPFFIVGQYNRAAHFTLYSCRLLNARS